MDPVDVLIDNSAIVKLTSYKKIFIQPGTTIDPFNNGKFTAEILSYQTASQSNPLFVKQYNKSVKQNIDDYYPLLNNSKWFEINKGGFEGVVNDFYYIGGDTTINNKHYYEIRFKSFKLPNVFNYPYSDYINSHSLIYLREDVANKKIYTPTKWNNSESLLYDFSLNINDKMPYDTAFTLIRIDTVEITGGARKRFNFQNKNNYKVTWIEGIGNISSPFHVDTPISDFDKLICSYQNNEVIYDEGVVNGINCTDYKDAESGLDDVEINSCTLYPNPTQGKFRISLNNTAKIKSLKIIDIYGKLVSDVGDNLNLDQIDLNISSLLRGVYFCVICTGNEVGTFKIIKE